MKCLIMHLLDLILVHIFEKSSEQWRVSGKFMYITFNFSEKNHLSDANSIDSDQKPQTAASDQNLYYLPMLLL